MYWKDSKIQKEARENSKDERPMWPMIILRTPKGWTGPKIVDDKVIEGSFRAHQVPIYMSKDEHLQLLEDWLRSYHPKELFNGRGRLIPELEVSWAFMACPNCLAIAPVPALNCENLWPKRSSCCEMLTIAPYSLSPLLCS